MRRTSDRWLLIALVVMLAASVPAAVSAAEGHLLTVTKSGTGGGVVVSDIGSLDCGSVCDVEYGPTDVVSLTADPNAVSTFAGWHGDCTGVGTCQVAMDVAHNVEAEFTRTYRPDGWIKLCGLSDGCTINGLPNPWKGKNTYNDTGANQTINVKMEDGEGVRFWLLFQIDGVAEDTFTIEGCKGTPKFKINKVQVGFYKEPTAGSVKINEAFKAGTAQFANIGPVGSGDTVKLTLNIIAPTTAEGVSYTCPITVHSSADPGATDTLEAKMTTY